MNSDIQVMAIDPGTTTGAARAIVKPRELVKDSFVGFETWEVIGSPAEQAWQIMDEFSDWSVIGGLPSFLVCESFSLGYFSRDKKLLDPVRVAAGMEVLAIRRDGLRWANVNYQSPSDAKTFATDDRLRAWGLWIKGSAHRRDATRHLALAISRPRAKLLPSRSPKSLVSAG